MFKVRLAVLLRASSWELKILSNHVSVATHRTPLRICFELTNNQKNSFISNVFNPFALEIQNIEGWPTFKPGHLNDKSSTPKSRLFHFLFEPVIFTPIFYFPMYTSQVRNTCYNIDDDTFFTQVPKSSVHNWFSGTESCILQGPIT